MEQIFYATLGEAQLGSRHPEQAEPAYQAALRLAELNLASIDSDASRAQWGQNSAPIYLGLTEAELEQGREQEALSTFEWYLGAAQRPGFAQVDERSRGNSETGRAPSLPAPSALADRLPLLTKETVLAYGLLPNGVAIWAYDNRGVTAKWVPRSGQEIHDLAANFYSHCADPNSNLDALHREGRNLYSLLVAPVESRLDSKRTLLIEPEGPLARLPFEALLDGNGHYLIERAALVHSPGLYAEAHLRSETPVSSGLPALLVASSASSREDGQFLLPDLYSNLDRVAGRFHSPQVLKGHEATLAATTDALPAAAILHFSGHAVSTPGRSGLLLAQDVPATGGSAPLDGARLDAPLLEANAIRRLRLQRLQIAFLAGCGTDSGEAGARGLDSVAQALQDSGVPHVIASRWSADSAAADTFSDFFYASLLSGEAVSTATHLASWKLLSDARTAHPFYWAAFAAYGRP